jgi:hypothetical protein
MSQQQTKEHILSLLDRLPESELIAAERFIEFLLSAPWERTLLTASHDDEPYTAEQRRADAEAVASIERGEGVPHAEILREFQR